MNGIAMRAAIVSGLMSVAVPAAVWAMAPSSAPKTTEWCAIYRGGSENCHFSTEAQCRSNVSGLGGFCRMSAYGTERRG